MEEPIEKLSQFNRAFALDIRANDLWNWTYDCSNK
ncbi:hypothetical protein A2U01_0095050, partial [Trifolium medium]|nr:hypothetical protein [Trifolium medium]